MIRRWIIYLASLIGMTVFYWAYQEWFSWLALVGVICLPVASLLMSLPAMLQMRLSVDGPAYLSVDAPQKAVFAARSRLPAPPYRGAIRVRRVTTGEVGLLKEGRTLPTEHCGQLLCRPEKAKVYDYLGLFFLKAQKKNQTSIIVRPRAIQVDTLPQLERYMSSSWRPKPGGGFSENHELRLYRPGDNLNQIHWKLSVKTGKYIIREPMEPEKNRVLLEMELRGTPEELDRKFGKLLGISTHLLQSGLKHELRVLTGKGIQCLFVSSETELQKAVDSLLSMPPAGPDAHMEQICASWQYRIGGDADEA